MKGCFVIILTSGDIRRHLIDKKARRATITLITAGLTQLMQTNIVN